MPKDLFSTAESLVVTGSRTQQAKDEANLQPRKAAILVSCLAMSSAETDDPGAITAEQRADLHDVLDCLGILETARREVPEEVA